MTTKLNTSLTSTVAFGSASLLALRVTRGREDEHRQDVNRILSSRPRLRPEGK